MKTTIIFLLLTLFVRSQENFTWEIIDSVAKTKDQIYSDTKRFVASTWRSAQDVIQNDDKEGGLIMVKGVSQQSSTFQMNIHDYTYQYTVSFFMKERKYRILLDDVRCISATCAGKSWPLVQPTEDTSKKQGGVPAGKLDEMMKSLKDDLNIIVNSYVRHISSVTASKEW